MSVVHLPTAAAGLPAPWSPRIVGDVNGHQVKVARIEGEFVWHSHAAEDEAFLVLAGRLRIELRDGVRDLGPGDFTVIPRGVEHRPVAAPGTCIALFEPASTVNTGEVRNERTVAAVPLGDSRGTTP